MVDPWQMTHISEEAIPVRVDADDLDDSSDQLSSDGEVENNLVPKFTPLKDTFSKHSQMTQKFRQILQKNRKQTEHEEVHALYRSVKKERNEGKNEKKSTINEDGAGNLAKKS